MPYPLVSIIVPTYNQRPDWLSKAVISAISQTVPVEIIVVDDGSDQKFHFLAPVRVVRQPKNTGVAAALNRGIQEMRTEWFSWLSSDDLIQPNKTEIQFNALKRTGLKASCHQYDVVDPDGNLQGYSALPHRMVEEIVRRKEQNQPLPESWIWPSLEAQKEDFAQNCWVNGSTTMIHKSVIDDVGPLDESYRFGQDWEWWVRIGKKYQWLFINKLLGRRREGMNLTEKLQKNPELWAIARAEDAKIRELGRQ